MRGGDGAEGEDGREGAEPPRGTRPLQVLGTLLAAPSLSAWLHARTGLHVRGPRLTFVGSRTRGTLAETRGGIK